MTDTTTAVTIHLIDETGALVFAFAADLAPGEDDLVPELAEQAIADCGFDYGVRSYRTAGLVGDEFIVNVAAIG